MQTEASAPRRQGQKGAPAMTPPPAPLCPPTTAPPNSNADSTSTPGSPPR